jgi:hypothetical protein
MLEVVVAPAPRWQGLKLRFCHLLVGAAMCPAFKCGDHPVPLAMMLSRGSGPNQKHALEVLRPKMGSPDPAVSTGFVHQLLNALPNLVGAILRLNSCGRSDRRFAIAFATLHRRPDHARVFVRERHCGDLGGPTRQKLQQSRFLGAVPLRKPDHRHRADDEHLSEVAVAGPRYASEPLLASRRVLLRHEADSGRQIASGPEHGRVGNGGDKGTGKKWADAGNIHQPATDISPAGRWQGRGDRSRGPAA